MSYDVSIQYIISDIFQKHDNYFNSKKIIYLPLFIKATIALAQYAAIRLGTLATSSKLNSSHFFYKGICTEIISVIFLHQTKCLITWYHNIQRNILIVHQKNIGLCCPFWIGFHIMLQKLPVQTYHFLSGKEKDASHISMTHAFLCTYLLYNAY